MELKEFIETTINEICDGIYLAKEKQYNKRDNAVIAPGRINGELYNVVEPIKFELYVEFEEKKSKKGGGKINVLSLNVDGEINKNDTIKSGNKITFNVPYFPAGLSPIKQEDPE